MPPLPLKQKKLPESIIQRKVIAAFELHGWLVVKILQTNKNGWPDLQCHKLGRTVFVECKREGKATIDPLQAYRHNELRKQGFKVIVINSIDICMKDI